MLKDSDFAELPEDPEHAFIAIEEKFRKQLQEFVEDDFVRTDRNELRLNYMNHTLAAREGLDLPVLEGMQLPSSEGEIYDCFIRFTRAVDFNSTQVRTRTFWKGRENSVELDENAKAKLRLLLTKIKEIIDRLEIDDDRKDSIYAKILGLEKEINKSQSNLDKVGAVWVTICAYAGQGADQLKPAVEILERVCAAFGIAKQQENSRSKKIPAPKVQRKLEPPKEKIRPPKDDIPF